MRMGTPPGNRPANPQTRVESNNAVAVEPSYPFFLSCVRAIFVEFTSA
jgi:hypothetical protein